MGEESIVGQILSDYPTFMDVHCFLKKKKKKPPNNGLRYIQLLSQRTVCRRKKRGSEKVRSLLKVQSDPAELEFESNGFAFLITIPYGLKPQ